MLEFECTYIGANGEKGKVCMRKKIVGILMLLLVLLVCACGKKEENTVQKPVLVIEENQVKESTVLEEVEKEEKAINGLIFSTEYKIEDYCNGHFIVSKNDGLLYGVLDMKGEEWIPCEYDNISFLNKYEVIDGKEDTLLFELRYENLHTVMDDTGKILIENVAGRDISYIKCEFGTIEEDVPWFVGETPMLKENQGISLYTKSGEVILDLQYADALAVDFGAMISNKYFMVGVNKSDDYVTYLYNINGEIINQWNGVSNVSVCGVEEYADKVNFFIYSADNYQHWTIDLNGNVEFICAYTKNEYENMMGQNIYSNVVDNRNRTDYSNDYFKLYKSNDTWKLEDVDGTTLYENRYYTCEAYKNYDGTIFNMFCLSNENGEAIAINRFGQKIIDYGWLTVKNEGWYTEMYFCGSRFDSTECYVEDEGICYIQGNDVYYFQGTV